MQVYKTTVTYHKTSGLPEDDIVNTYHFRTIEDDPDPETASQLNGWLAAKLFDAENVAGDNLHTYMAAEVSRVALPTLRTYDVAGGSPLATDTMAGLQVALGNGLPSEVCVCLSFHGDLTDIPEFAPDDADPGTAPNRPASSLRNRIYWGPIVLGGITGSPGRPTVGLIQGLQNLALLLSNPTDIQLANGLLPVWVTYSPKTGFADVVTGCWVDDAFDTQRRRGVAPTNRNPVAL